MQAIMGMKVICFELDGLLRETGNNTRPLNRTKATLLASSADHLVGLLTVIAVVQVGSLFTSSALLVGPWVQNERQERI